MGSVDFSEPPLLFGEAWIGIAYPSRPYGMGGARQYTGGAEYIGHK